MDWMDDAGLRLLVNRTYLGNNRTFFLLAIRLFLIQLLHSVSIGGRGGVGKRETGVRGQ